MTTSTIHKLHPVQSNSNADKSQLVNWFMSKLMLGTAVYWDPAIGSTIWIAGCICTEQNPTESYQTERHLKDNMQISNWPTFEEIKLLDNKLKLLWTEGHVKLFELRDIWNEIDHCFLHAFCMSPRPHSSEPQPAPQSSPCDCSAATKGLPNFPLYRHTASLTGNSTPKSEVWQRVMCIHNPRDVTNWMMNHELSWGYNVAFFYTSMSVKSQRLRRTRHQRVLKTFILHHLVATVHPGQCGRQDAAWQHKKISNVSVQPQINADNDSLGARLNMRRKREQVRHKQDHLLKSPHCSIGTCMNQWINPRPHNNSIIWQIISDNYITPHRPSMHWSSQSVWVNLS